MLPSSLQAVSRGLLSWNIFAAIYLLALWVLIVRTENSRIKQIARIQDEQAATVLALVICSSVISLLAIFLELGEIRHLNGLSRTLHFSLALLTLFSSWMLLPTAFAIHYAHLFYLADAHDEPLRFPDQTKLPSYWDFVYFSFTIATGAQTSDTSVTNSQTRKLAILQSTLSFFFNMAILGLMVNATASLIN